MTASHAASGISVIGNGSKPAKAIATLETVIMMNDFMAFNVPSYLESMALAGVHQHVVVARVSFLIDIIFVVSGNITGAQARSSVAQVTALPEVGIIVTVRSKDNLGRRTSFLEPDTRESVLEITLNTTDAQVAQEAARKTLDTAAMTRAFTEQTASVKSLEVKGYAQAVLVSTQVEAGQSLNSTILSTTLSQKLGANVTAATLEDGRFDELLFAAADFAPQTAVSEAERSRIDSFSSEVFVTMLLAAAMVALCLLLAMLVRCHLRPSKQSKVAPMHPAVPAWLP